MNILEQEIEELVWNAIKNGHHDELNDRGLPIWGCCHYERQLDFGAYGRADLVGFNCEPLYVSQHKKRSRGIGFDIFEFKKEKIDVSTLLQAGRYVKSIKEMFGSSGIKTACSIEYMIHLVGKSVDMSGDFPFFIDACDFLKVYTYKFDLLKGLTFEEVPGFHKANPCFKKDLSLTSFLKQSLRRQLKHYEEERQSISEYMDSCKDEPVPDVPF